MEISVTEENYLKSIFLINEANNGSGVSTNQLSGHLNNKAASVTEMLKRLSAKKLINYQKYKGVILSSKGEKLAMRIVRKHRLWESFLVDKLNYRWDEVHEIAEQLEHIQSDDLIDRLSVFLGNPRFDPHGDPIPDSKGNLYNSKSQPLSAFNKKGNYTLSAVSEHSKSFLQYLTSLGLKIGDPIKVEEINTFDHSFRVQIKGKEQFFSNRVAANILVEKKK
jgi:DtxR family transcriptional regulator, Mn-dependent transcriptional regulator